MKKATFISRVFIFLFVGSLAIACSSTKGTGGGKNTNTPGGKNTPDGPGDRNTPDRTYEIN